MVKKFYKRYFILYTKITKIHLFINFKWAEEIFLFVDQSRFCRKKVNVLKNND